MLRRLTRPLLPAAVLLTVAAGCGQRVDNRRLPAYPVDINLSGSGMWSTYGVGGVGMWREFIKSKNVPAGFPWLANTFTGFGGVLLVGVDPASVFADAAWPYAPMAYDLSCPVEADPEIRVYVDDSSFEAVCPVCESRYTLMAGGGPVAGPAVQLRYGLEPYNCMGSPMSGFIITRRK